MSSIELTSKIRELKELEAMQEELTAEIEAIKDTIKTHMSTTGAEELTVDVYKVRYKEVTSSRFDAKAFKATHADLYSQYTKETTTRRFQVA